MPDEHPIIHIELSSKDLGQSEDFYSKVFDWKIQQFPAQNYATFRTGSGQDGGFNPVTDTNPAGTVLVYIGTDNIDDTIEQIKKHGGKIELEKTLIPTVGWYAVFTDPSGNRMGVLMGLEEGPAGAA